MENNFFKISALVALVPMPLPLICSRSSSFSMSCPAFSIAKIIEPELYRFGGEVSPSFTEHSVRETEVPFFKRLSTSFKSKLSSFSSSFSSADRISSGFFFFVKEYWVTGKNPSSKRTFVDVKKRSSPAFTVTFSF